MTYTFADGGDGALKIYQDGVEVASIDGDEVSIFKNTTQGYVELSDSEHVFFGININEVSGATTLQDIVDAIEAALPNDSNTGVGGGGDILSDGSVDFVATETWDDGLGSTVAVSPGTVVVTKPEDATTVTVSPVSVVAFDGTNTTTVQAGAVITDNGAGGTSTLATASLFITDGSAAVTIAPTQVQGGGALDVTSGGNMAVTSGRKIDLTAASGFNISILLSGAGKFNIGAAIFGALPVYANIAAATTAGLVSGDWFATTTTGVIVQIP